MSQTVGERLKKVRTERGLSLDQAAQTTRIRKNYLEALERGDHEALPSAVQGRGFLRLYAGYLNLPAEELVAEWEGRPFAVPQAPLPEPVRPPRKKLIFNEPAPVPQPAEEPDQSEPPEEPSILGSEPIQGSSKAIFFEIGSALRRQREILGLSLSDVERHTRLRQHYLRAFEAGRLDDLPSTVQSRGMLSNYAAFLNMDVENFMLRFAEGLQLRRLERLPPVPEPGLFTKKRAQAKGGQPGTQARKLITPDLLFIGGLILVLFVFIVWTAARISSDRSTPANATLPSVSDVLLYTASPSAPVLSPSPSGPAPSQTDEASTVGESTVEATAPPAGTPSPPAQTGGPTATLGAINQDPVQVYIVARRRAFLRVTIDGQIKFNGRTVPGNAYPFSGQKTIEILTGDAAALQLFYNQRDLGSLGTSGQALDLSFTKEGVLTPTATITPTITVTPLISATLTPGSSISPTPSPTVTPLVP